MPVVVTDLGQLTGFGFITAALAVMYYRFTKPGEVLAWWGKLIRSLYYKLTVKDPANLDTYVNYEWVLKPILTCETCIAGQVSLWLFLAVMPFDLLALLYVIGVSTLVAPLLVKLLRE